MNEYNEYQIASALGIIIAIGWIVAYLLCWAGQWAWAWVDDSEMGKRNLMIKFLMTKLWGYKLKDNYFLYQTQYSVSDGDGPFFLTGISTAFLPMSLLLCFNFYEMFLITMSIIGSAQLTRYVRRQQKLFVKHIKDKNAHD